MADLGQPLPSDFIGATQFRLLCTLGLLPFHKVLDFGCGSLHAGKILIPYLGRGNYYGIEPNSALIDASIREQIGEDQVRFKAPTFSANDSFTPSFFGQRFDFIVAESIFSHTGSDLVERGLRGIRESLHADGLAAVTFIEAEEDFAGNGWIYPECVSFTRRSVLEFARRAELHSVRIPWFHPRKAWFLLARDAGRLPTPQQRKYLTGAVLHAPELREDEA